MRIVGASVKVAIPASLKSDVGIVHGLQLEAIDGSINPDIRGIAVDPLSNVAGTVDVEDMPLQTSTNQQCATSERVSLTVEV